MRSFLGSEATFLRDAREAARALLAGAFQVNVFLLLCAFALGANAAEISTTFVVDSPTLIAFAPPQIRAATDSGAMEAIGHLQYAVETTRKCVLPKKLEVVIAYADVIVVRNGPTTESLPVRTMGQAIGGILLAPGKKAKVVASQVGPSSLQQLLPAAAADYFKANGCLSYDTSI